MAARLLMLLALHLSPWMRMGGANALEPLTVSLQFRFPYVPYYISKQRGDYVKLGFELTDITYPSGPPQIQAALVNKSWDVGTIGMVPAIIGGQSGILNIGIASDDSACTQLIGTAEMAANWPPASLEGLTIAMTQNSISHYVAQACLATYDTSQATFAFLQQDACAEAVSPLNGSAPTAQLASLWSPFTHRVLDHSNGSKVLCNGESVYKTVTSAMIVRPDYAAAKPEQVTKFLAGWLRGITFMKNESNREQVVAYALDYHRINGLNISRADIESDLDTFSFFDLDEQLAQMKRARTPPYSNYDVWTIDASDFLVANRILETYAEPNTYITDKFLRIIKNNSILYKFAMGEDVDVTDVQIVIEEQTETVHTSNVANVNIWTAGGWMLVFGMIGGWVI